MDVNKLMIQLNYRMLPANTPVEVCLTLDCRGADGSMIHDRLVRETGKYLSLNDRGKPICKITASLKNVDKSIDVVAQVNAFHKTIATEPWIKQHGAGQARGIDFVIQIPEGRSKSATELVVSDEKSHKTGTGLYRFTILYT